MKKFEKIKFELIQVEKNYRSGITMFIRNRTLFIIGRTVDNTKVIFFINDFYPRFFVEKDENIDYIIEEHKDKIKEIKDENFKNLGGKKELLTIYTYTTQSVVDLRDFFSKTYQANIRFTEVFKRDKLIKGFFYVPDYVFTLKTRNIKIRGRNYIMLKENEIDGGELIF